VISQLVKRFAREPAEMPGQSVRITTPEALMASHACSLTLRHIVPKLRRCRASCRRRPARGRQQRLRPEAQAFEQRDRRCSVDRLCTDNAFARPVPQMHRKILPLLAARPRLAPNLQRAGPPPARPTWGDHVNGGSRTTRAAIPTRRDALFQFSASMLSMSPLSSPRYPADSTLGWLMLRGRRNKRSGLAAFCAKAAPRPIGPATSDGNSILAGLVRHAARMNGFSAVSVSILASP